MPSEEKIGISLFKESVKGKKHGDVVLDSLQKALARLNKEATKETTRLYESVFKKMNINNSTGLIVNSVENLALVSEMTGGLEPITGSYRAAYGQLIRDYREEKAG
jgi:hydrogenase maturation factor